MVLAFKRFKEIEKLNSLQEKHRTWLKDYEGMSYSIAEDGKHKMKWMREDKKYSDKDWKSDINCIKELKTRCRIEYDDNDEKKAKENLELAYKKLKENNLGFIRSTHKGKCDYLWIEFNKEVNQKQKESFLVWVSPEGSVIDLNFTSSRRVFPILYAIHWRHSFERELPIEYFEGDKIDLNKLDIKTNKKVFKKSNLTDDYEYKIGEVFTRKGQAQVFVEKQPIFYDKAGIFWKWNDELKCWEISDEVELLNVIEESTGQDIISSKNRTEIINALKQIGRKNIPKDIKETWIQFKNKIYDIKTGESFYATPKYFATNPIPYEVSGDPRTPTMDKIFKEWAGEDYSKTLYQIIAYCLLPSYPIHRIFCLIGVGLNGKSKFLDLIRKFIGTNNCCSTELDHLLNSRFEVTRLHKKLVCQMGETNFNEINKTSILKKLSGGDLIGFEYKNKNPFEEKNYAKIIISTNNLPTTTDKTIGFYRRWLIIDFPNQFSEKKDILEDIPEEEYSNLATNCIIILNELISEREFHNEGSIEDRIKRYEAKSNFLEEFKKKFIIEDLNNFITKADFYKKFISWSKENRHREMSETSVGLNMKKLEIESGTKHFDWLHDGKGGNARVWLGIKWIE